MVFACDQSHHPPTTKRHQLSKPHGVGASSMEESTGYPHEPLTPGLQNLSPLGEETVTTAVEMDALRMLNQLPTWVWVKTGLPGLSQRR